MIRRFVNLNSPGIRVLRVTMAQNYSQDFSGHRYRNKGYRGQQRGGFGRPNSRSSHHRSEAYKDNGVQGSQYSHDGQGQNYENNSIQGGLPGSYPHNETRGGGHRNDNMQGTPQPGNNQGNSEDGHMTQRNSIKGDMVQSDRQGDESNFSQGDFQEGIGGAQPDSYLRGSQESSGVSHGHRQGTEADSYQGQAEKNNDWGQCSREDSTQGDQPIINQQDSQKGKDGYDVECTQSSAHKDNSKERIAMGQSHGNNSMQTQSASSQKDLQKGGDGGQSQGNDSIKRTQPASHQNDSQKYSDRGQSHGNDAGQWNKHGSNQDNWRTGGDNSGAHYQDHKSGSYQRQKDFGHEDRYRRQASSDGGFRRDNFDQQRKRNWDENEDDIFLSKKLSFILRHGAEKLKFKLMPGGFLYVDEILKKMQKLEGFTVEDVQRIVAQNDKQRFAIQKEEGTGRLKIRANQGHTVEVEDLELTPITSADQVPLVLHGTYQEAWNSIKKQGLCRFKRNHIHFAAGEPGENGVISGMRSSCDVLIYIDLEKALKDGLKFFLSANNVILSPGNDAGYIYPCYFKAVLNRHPRYLLEFDSNIKGKNVTADQIADNADKKKRNKKRKNKEERESNESVVSKEEIKDAGDKNLAAGAGEKVKEEGRDEEDQYEDAMETQPEKSMQINVPDQWDEADNTEQTFNGRELSDGFQRVSGSKDLKGTKESKTKDQDFRPETSKSKAQSNSQAQKETTKPETPQRNVILENEQKATKTRAVASEDEDEGTSTAMSEGADVKIEEEWLEIYITSAEESQSAVEYVMTQTEPVSIICCGEKIGEGDGTIAVLVISIQGRTWIYQLYKMDKDFMEAGKLKQLFFDTDLMKVFHDVTWQSSVLFKQYEIVLDGTKVFDTKVVSQMKLLDDKAMDSLRLEGFMPLRWVEEDGKMDNSKWRQDPLNKDLICKLVERCKALLQFYKMFTEEKLSQPRKEIYAEVNKFVDKKISSKIRKDFQSKAKNKTPKEQSSSGSKAQGKGSGSSKKKRQGK